MFCLMFFYQIDIRDGHAGLENIFITEISTTLWKFMFLFQQHFAKQN